MKFMDLLTLEVIGFLRSWIVSLAAKCLSNHHLRPWFSLEIILSGSTLVMEAISASLEQTSPHKLKTVAYGLITAAISIFFAFVLLALKYYNRRNISTVRNEGRHMSLGHRLGWRFADTFGLISSMLTLGFASLHYHYLSNGKRQPIRFSMLPLAFSVCVFCSCLFRRPSDRCGFHHVMEHGEDRPFACSVCRHSLHPSCYYV